MQIDFHHAATYVAARLAGFAKEQAEIVAHSAQYVDDATCSGPVRFKNRFLYSRISSAHKMIDLRNIKDLANHQVWIPFHFLPGNNEQEAGRNSKGKAVERLICRPNSPVAKEMVREAIAEMDKPYGLHRLGVVMHVYADTWAHQGFAGLLDDVNKVNSVKETGKSGVFGNSLEQWYEDMVDNFIPPLGHGEATIYPDMPFLKWQYEDHTGKIISRDNTADFLEAANEMCKAMQRSILQDPDAGVDGIGPADMAEMKNLFKNTKMKKGEERHEVWLKAIKDGKFSIGKEEVTYITDKNGSWKHQALGTIWDCETHPYKKAFLKSNWKLFHDAIKAHRFYVVNELLPQYNICAA